MIRPENISKTIWTTFSKDQKKEVIQALITKPKPKAKPAPVIKPIVKPKPRRELPRTRQLPPLAALDHNV